ncbi:MAG TPA: hypothetical protein ENI78_00845 [Euryarchaeota archaeon]|nr:hypothetical protein [Euryarchaeota archaeon]
MEIGGNIIEKMELLNVARKEVKKVIVGQDRVLGRLLTCLLCDAYILLDGVLVLAKTLMTNTLASTIDAKFSKIQFTIL